IEIECLQAGVPIESRGCARWGKNLCRHEGARDTSPLPGWFPRRMNMSSTIRSVGSSMARRDGVKLRAWAYVLGMVCRLVTLALFSMPILYQTSPEKTPEATVQTADSQEGPLATFRAHTDLVLIPVTVTDKLNRFVLGLQKEDFRLFEDGVEQKLEI